VKVCLGLLLLLFMIMLLLAVNLAMNHVFPLQRQLPQTLYIPVEILK
jgi:hypothetical protein